MMKCPPAVRPVMLSTYPRIRVVRVIAVCNIEIRMIQFIGGIVQIRSQPGVFADENWMENAQLLFGGDDGDQQVFGEKVTI